jgi:hypothetical protein
MPDAADPKDRLSTTLLQSGHRAAALAHRVSRALGRAPRRVRSPSCRAAASSKASYAGQGIIRHSRDGRRQTGALRSSPRDARRSRFLFGLKGSLEPKVTPRQLDAVSRNVRFLWSADPHPDWSIRPSDDSGPKPCRQGKAFGRLDCGRFVCLPRDVAMLGSVDGRPTGTRQACASSDAGGRRGAAKSFSANACETRVAHRGRRAPRESDRGPSTSPQRI